MGGFVGFMWFYRKVLRKLVFSGDRRLFRGIGFRMRFRFGEGGLEERLGF